VNVNAVILRVLAEQESAQSGELVRATGITRQALHRHLAALTKHGEIIASGAGRAARYRLAAHRRIFRLAGLEEDRVYETFVAPALAAIARSTTVQAQRAFRYAFTEMLNNAIDHSNGARVEVIVEKSNGRAVFQISDDGVGAFARIRRGLKLANDTSAIGELSKGKVTTAPGRHTGEGIFFTSKIAELFEIESNALLWRVDNTIDDTAIGRSSRRKGTRVRFELSPRSKASLEKLFGEYTKDFQFSKTRTWVKLFALGTSFVSRSEARRLTARLERFEEVVLDFQGVEMIGQGFADEVFRVWAAAHPKVKLRAVRAIAPVEFMISRAYHPR
jgi:DNA-binding transcriptional ArsR family regulator